MKIKHLFNDSFKTLVSNMIMLLTVQFLLLPIYAHKFTPDFFGVILTLYGLVSLFSTAIGNTLNNIRLIYAEKDKQKFLSKQYFNILLVNILIICIIFSFILIVHFHIGIIDTLLIIFLLILMTVRIYLIVFFRLRMDFNALIKQSILYFIGLILGVLFFLLFMNWLIPLIMGELFSVFYVIIYLKNMNYSFIKEKINNRNISKHYYQLLTINSIYISINYFDRFLIFSLLGGKAVAIVFITTFIGKFILSLITPLNSVMLSYLSNNNNNNISQKSIFKLNIYLSIAIFLISISIVYPGTYILSKYFYNIDFKTISGLTILGNLGVLLNVIGNILFPLMMKYAPIKLQSRSQFIYFVIYFMTTIFLTKIMGIQGFFYGLIISNLIRSIIILFIVNRYTRDVKV